LGTRFFIEELLMSLKKFLETPRKKSRMSRIAGQSFIEYVLLTGIALVAIIASSSFVINLKNGAFTQYFNSVKSTLTNDL
jgi:Flp pilus assembly pilin Flp